MARVMAAKPPVPSIPLANGMTDKMSSRLSLLSDDEIAQLRARVDRLTRMGTPAQRQASSGQLEAIDVERERRLVAPPT